MELDELKSTWQMLEQKLERETRISAAILRHHKYESARASLRPLFAGQMVQLFGGVLVILFAGLLWSTRPDALPVIIAGVVVHAYGIGCIIAAGWVLAAIQGIDYAGSVLEVQGKLARVRRAFVISGIVLGLTWWYLWIPFLMVLAGLGHVNLYAHAPAMVWISILIGTVGLAGMLGLYAYSRRQSSTGLRQFVDNAVLGRGLQQAQAQLDEIRRFEEELA